MAANLRRSDREQGKSALEAKMRRSEYSLVKDAAESSFRRSLSVRDESSSHYHDVIAPPRMSSVHIAPPRYSSVDFAPPR